MGLMELLKPIAKTLMGKGSRPRYLPPSREPEPAPREGDERTEPPVVTQRLGERPLPVL